MFSYEYGKQIYSHARMACLFLLLAQTSGCGGGGSGGGDGGGNPEPPVVATVAVTPPAPTLVVGATMELSATARDSAGRVVTGRPVLWTTEDDSKVAVNASGVVTAVAQGTTRVSAQVDNRWGWSTVTVIAPEPPPPVVASVEITRPNATVEEGATHQFSAVARDANGGVITGRGSHWSVQDSGIAIIDGSGQITALRPGVTAVTVRIDGQSASGSVRVQADYPFQLLFDAVADDGIPGLFTRDVNDPAATEVAIRTSANGAQDATASPNGAQIAYAETRPWGTVIMVADRDGANQVQLTAEGSSSDQPDWSPDGTRIAFRRRAIGADSDIWVMDADGANAVNLTASHGATNQASPSWSPQQGDGSYLIAYAHAAAGRSHIFTMRDDGSDKRQITFAADVFDDQPDWSPDGNRIVYIRSASAVFGDLYVVNTFGGTGGLLMQLAGPLAGPQRAPAWSPDGQLVAFESRHSGDHFQIYTVWFDGTRLAARTFDAVDHASPAWLATP